MGWPEQGLSWMRSGQWCRLAVPGTGWYRGGRWGLSLLGARGKGTDVLRMHHAGGPDGLGEAGGTVPGWRSGLGRPCEGQQSQMHILPLGWKSPRYQDVLGAAQLGNGLAEKALRVLVDTS